MKADGKPGMVRSELFEVITVFMAVVCLRFGGVLVFPGRFLIVPVHVRKRGARLKAATAAHFFVSGCSVKIPRA